MLKGVNTTSCPSYDGEKIPILGQEELPVQLETNSGELEIVADSIINVRADPTTLSVVIARVRPGDIFSFEDTENGWYQIIIREGTVGWIFGEYVSVLRSR